MPRTAFKKTGRWAELKRALDPRVFRSVSRKHIRRATGINGLLAVRSVRYAITHGEVEPNAALTAAIKGSARPLVDRGDLRQSVTHKLIDDFRVFVGVLKTNNLYNIAVTLHERVVIPVTGRMKTMFFYLWLKQHEPEVKLTGRAAELWERFKGPWRRLEKPAIINPRRPFIQIAFADPVLHQHVMANWAMAIAKTLRELVR